MAVILGVALRVAHLFAMPATTVWRWPEVGRDLDMSFNVAWAEHIREDPLGREAMHPFTPAMERMATEDQWREWHGTKVFQQVPLYVYLLALLRLPMILYLLQIALGGVATVCVAWLAWTWADKRKDTAAVVAAFGYALAQPIVALDALLLRDSFAISLFAIALWALEARRTHAASARWSFGVGALMGLGTLLRENFILLALVAVILGASARARVLTLAGFFVLFSPLMARNIAVGAPAFALSAIGTESIAAGLYPAEDSDPVGYKQTQRLPELLTEWKGSVFRALLGVLSEAASHPGRALRIWGTKAWALVSPLEPADNVGLTFLELQSPALRATLPTALFFVPAAFGLWVVWRLRRSPIPFVGVGFVAATLTLVPFVWRFRAGALPALVPLAAIGLLLLLEPVLKGPRTARAFAPLGAALVLSAGLWLFPPQPLWHERLYDSYLKIAVLVEDGRWDDGLAELDRYYAGRPAGPEGPVGARIRYALHSHTPLPQP